MAKSVSSVKKAKTGPGKLIKRIVAITFSVLVIIFSLTYLSNADRAAQDTVAIVRVRSNDLPAFTTITRDNVERYEIIRREYVDGDNGMVLFDDVDSIVNLLSAYHIRGNTFLYRNQLIDERPQRNVWLYQLSDEYEVVTIPYNYMEAGGDILLPGDQIRIRVIYEDEASDTSDGFFDTNPNFFYSPGNRPMRADVLFDSIEVADMINSNARSIYEIYSEVLRLNEENRQSIMKSSEFMSSIRPRALLLAATPEQVDTYARYKAATGSGSFLITILSRANSEVILDQLPTLESEVNSWITETRGS